MGYILHNYTKMPDKKTKEKLEAIVKSLPGTPGVYQFFGEGKILYVGKAKNLKNRVRTYFRKDDKRVLRIEKLMEKADDLKYIEVDTELEAFILETNLIKELHPKYNVLMKDDKNYAYIKVTQNEDFPMIEVVRKMEKDGAKYFGPKTSAGKAREMIDLLHKLFRFRNCRLGLRAVEKGSDYERDNDQNIKVEVTNKVINYPCLEYHIRRCDAPCIGKVTPEEYRRNMDGIIAFLEGKHGDVIEHLKKRMAEAVLAKNFEYAAILRDKLLAVENVQEKQKISEATFASRDVISFVIMGDKAFFNVFVIRDGKLINQENFIVDTQLKGLVDPRDKDLKAEILERFMRDFYENSGDLPKEILVSEEGIDTGFLEKWLSMTANSMVGSATLPHKASFAPCVTVKIHAPKKGDKSKLLELSLKNAESFAAQCEVKWDTEQARTIGACTELGEVLGISRVSGQPYVRRIECFDISHISGHETVASMAVFEDGKPKKSDYRHFTIRTVGKGDIDDFKSMEEVIARRLKYLKGVEDIFAKWKGYKVRKAKKDELAKVNELKKSGGWNSADNVNGYFLMENPEGETVGVCCIVEKSRRRDIQDVEHDKLSIYHFKNLYIADSERGKDLGRFMISKVISEVESPVVYIVTGLELLEYYEEFGFKPLKSADVPHVLAESVKACEKKYSGAVVMRFDKESMYSKYGRLKVKRSKDEKSNVFEFAGEVFKIPVCNVRVQILDKKGALISEVEVKDAYKGRGLQFEVLEKVYKDTDASTFYLVVGADEANIYLKNGFEEIKTAPEEVLKNVGKNDVTLAYYRAKQQKEDASFGAVPDLIVIDGGKGQLSSAMKAVKAVKDAGVTVNVCSLAKKQEDVYVPSKSEPILLEKDSNAQYLLQRIRDEAHRFAITHNRNRREKEMLK